MYKFIYVHFTTDTVDPSPVVASVRNKLKSVSHGKALRSSLYRKLEDIEVVLLELVVEVCRRSRRVGCIGRVVSVGAAETDGQRSASFNRQVTLSQPTSLSHEVAAAALGIFRKYWSGMPVSHLFIALTQLTDDSIMQLTFFDDRIKTYSLERATDDIKDKYGSTAIMRASSLLQAGVARERAEQIGGHYK